MTQPSKVPPLKGKSCLGSPKRLEAPAPRTNPEMNFLSSSMFCIATAAWGWMSRVSALLKKGRVNWQFACFSRRTALKESGQTACLPYLRAATLVISGRGCRRERLVQNLKRLFFPDKVGGIARTPLYSEDCRNKKFSPPGPFYISSSLWRPSFRRQDQRTQWEIQRFSA